MNEMNDLELQLRSWAPRRPSASVERLIFSLGAKERTTPLCELRALPRAWPAPDWTAALRRFGLSWVASGAAALVLLAVLFNQRYPGSSAAPSPSGPMVAMVLSNQSLTAWLPGACSAHRNTLPC